MGVLYDGNGKAISDRNPMHVKIAGTEDTGGGALGVNVKQSEIIQPVEIQSRYTHLVKTHDSTSILHNTWGSSAWIDSHVNGTPLTFLSPSVNMTGGTGLMLSLELSHDGVSVFSSVLLHDGTGAMYSDKEEAKLSSRYFRLVIKNKDATTPKTTNAYAYLKA